MAPSANLILEGCKYSKAKAKLRCQRILLRATPGERLTGTDHRFLADLIAYHPHHLAKVGSGVSHFTVERGPSLWLHRADGSKVGFSYKHCLWEPTHKDRIRKVLRFEIAGQLSEFCDQAFADTDRLRCPVTKRSVTPEDCDVHHAPPWTFARLADTWAEGIGGYEVVRYGGDCLSDPDQAASWLEYHASHARLRIVSPEGNQVLSARYQTGRWVTRRRRRASETSR
jgi:hypothetical protein